MADVPSHATCLPVLFLIDIIHYMYLIVLSIRETSLPRSVSLVRYSFPARSAPEATEQTRTVDSGPLARVDDYLEVDCFIRVSGVS